MEDQTSTNSPYFRLCPLTSKITGGKSIPPAVRRYRVTRRRYVIARALICWFPAFFFFFSSFAQKKSVDMILYNARIYTADSSFSVKEALAVRSGRIVATGTSYEIRSAYKGRAVDAGKKAVFPGFIDGHAHFLGYGLSLREVNLTGTKSWQEVIERVKAFANGNDDPWIIGRGWDQNDWSVKEFPDNSALNKAFPGRAVILNRIDGHAAIANEHALKLAGIQAGQKVEGGEIGLAHGVLNGVLIDNAVRLVQSHIPVPGLAETGGALLAAQRNCFSVGLTTVADCGVDYPLVGLVDSLQKKGRLKMRLYLMLSDEPANYSFLFTRGAIKTERLSVRSFKVYADGALGSRGACLLEPYHDRPHERGFLLSDAKHFEEVARKIYEKGFQMCTHAIGDSANREILRIYGSVLNGKNDLRWRIEHAQVVSSKDFNQFGLNNVIPSVQPTHATSDMYWVEERLGRARISNAYAYRKLKDQNGWLVLGTDFPVESIDPLLTFAAATTRKDQNGYPKGGFHPENSLTREDALRGMTIWAARGNYEEREKGSLEPGKVADFVMLDKDIMQVADQDLFHVRVVSTWLNGELVYKSRR